MSAHSLMGIAPIEKLFMILVLYVVTYFITLPANAITVGAEQVDTYLSLVSEKRVGVVVNQSSRVGDIHLVDKLLSKHINVVSIFSPEHGFRGDKGAGEKVKSDVDEATGIPVYSLYGKHKKPTAEMLEEVEILIFDIQDVGVRFYTYISTLHYIMEAANENGIEVLVLDRPNPNIRFVAGPVLDLTYQSFVGMHPIPVLHGLTVGELARMIKGEGWINNSQQLTLHVISVKNYDRSMSYELPIKPSPNLPNAIAIRLYPSLCFFEPTTLSVGRGTPFPFQIIGHDKIVLGNQQLRPVSMPQSAPSPKFQDQTIHVLSLKDSDIQGLDLSLLFEIYEQMQDADLPFFTSSKFFDRLAGTDQLRLALINGQSYADVSASWEPALHAYRKMRQPYLMYE